jgi:hypothetical protein
VSCSSCTRSTAAADEDVRGNGVVLSPILLGLTMTDYLSRGLDHVPGGCCRAPGIRGVCRGHRPSLKWTRGITRGGRRRKERRRRGPGALAVRRFHHQPRSSASRPKVSPEIDGSRLKLRRVPPRKSAWTLDISKYRRTALLPRKVTPSGTTPLPRRSDFQYAKSGIVGDPRLARTRTSAGAREVRRRHVGRYRRRPATNGTQRTLPAPSDRDLQLSRWARAKGHGTTDVRRLAPWPLGRESRNTVAVLGS